MYVYHWFNLRHKLFPKTPTKGNAIRPVLQVQNEYQLNFSEKLSKRYYLISHNPNESSETPPKLAQKTPLSDPTQAASSSSAASESSNANRARFIMTDTTPKRENVYASIDKTLTSQRPLHD